MSVREVSPSRHLSHWTCAFGPKPRFAPVSEPAAIKRSAILLNATDGMPSAAFNHGSVTDIDSEFGRCVTSARINSRSSLGRDALELKFRCRSVVG